MNRDDVIRLAKQADASFETADSMFCFSALIESAATERANERANASWALMCEKMVAAEREACAKVCESERDALNENLQVWQENPTLTPCDEFVADWDSEAKIGEQYAAAIRARGQK